MRSQEPGCPSLVSVAVIKLSKIDCWLGRFYLVYPSQSQPIAEGSQGRRSSRQELEAETREEHYLLACFLWLVQMPFLKSLAPSAQGWPSPQWSGPFPISINNQEYAPQRGPQARLIWKVPQLRFHFPRWLVYIKLTNPKQCHGICNSRRWCLLSIKNGEEIILFIHAVSDILLWKLK